MSVLALQGWLGQGCLWGGGGDMGALGWGIALGRDVDQPDTVGSLHECGGSVGMMQPSLCAALGNGHSKVHG